MVNVGCVVQQSVEYYVAQVAGNAEEYYSVCGEAQGQWIGSGGEELGLSGTIKAEEFIAALNGRRPGEEAALAPRFDGRKVRGIDTVFRAPKSVSLMHAFGSPEIKEQVLESHNAAVLAGVDYLERRAARGREGKAGVRKVRGAGLISAAWIHRTSRAGDPLLHTHVVSANMIHTENDRWVTLDSNRIFRHAKTAGVLYQTELRRQLSERLDVRWQPVVNGLADVDGIDRKTVLHFSKRKGEIQAELDLIEGTSPKAAQLAALTTRKAKGSQQTENMAEAWAAEGAEIGFGAESVAALCGQPRLSQVSAARAYEPLAKQLVSPSGLTAHRSTFDRRDVIAALAERLPVTTSAEDIEGLADRWISEYAVALRTADIEGELRGGIRYQGAGEDVLTTLDMIDVELKLVESAIGRAGEGVACIPPHVSARMPVSDSAEMLNEEQREMVNYVIGSGNGVDVVIGDAGTGKTFALGVMRESYEAAGFRVIGAALAHRAVHELHDGAGIESRTIASLLGSIERDGARDVLAGGGKATVLVIDEAAMVGTRDLARLHAAAAEAGAKLVLVGDDKQLASIDAGGAFASFAVRIGAARLQQNMRQRNEPERAVASAFAEGRVADAVAIGFEHQSFRSFESRGEATSALVRDWLADPLRGDSRIIAATNAEIDQINSLCQQSLLGAGQLTGDPIETANGKFYEGDRVSFLFSDKRQGIINRDFATVVGRGEKPGQMLVRVDRTRQEIWLGAATTGRAGTMRLGYASTAHVAQGATVDSCYTLHSEAMTREHMYVAVSRGRERNLVYASESVDIEDAGFGDDIFEETKARIARSLTRSEAQTLAIDINGVVPADGVDREAAELRADMLETSLVQKPPPHVLAAIGEPPKAAEALAAWSGTAAQIEVYRAKWNFADTDSAIGERPTEPHRQRDWRKTDRSIAQFKVLQRQLHAPQRHSLRLKR